MNLRILLTISCLLLAGQPPVAQNPQSGWDFRYPGDSFSTDALLDLRFLNEEEAGQNGFIRMSEQGGYFVNDRGPIRFWAVNGGELVRDHDPDLNDRDLDAYARFLAKMGVNMIRYHGQLFSVSDDMQAPNRNEAERIWRVVAAMKRHGIYTTISPLWPAHMEDIPESWGLGDYSGNTTPWGLIYFHQGFRDAYKNWVNYLYDTENPITGGALKDDPAVALIQIINEDGVFFWTIGAAQPSLSRLMQQQFFNWAQAQYGDINNALSNWQNTTLEQDQVAQGRLEIINIWHATDDPNVPPQSEGFRKRLSDQMHFFAETQRAVYQEFYDHYRSIGCRQLINASNWRTASSGRLLDLERWSTLPAEVLAMNRYYDPGHFGPNNGWRIERLHHYQGESALHHPHRLPINVKQVQGRPFLITESGWNLPHKYQAEGPFLIAAYQSLTGVDGFYWFNPSSINYDEDPYWPYFGRINGEEPMFRWTLSTPGQMAMFPANALAFRSGYIRQGEPVVREHRDFQSMVERVLPIVTEEKSFDPNRDFYSPNVNAGETLLSPLTYLAGPVLVNYEGIPDSTFVHRQLDRLVDIPAMELTSNTGELTWDYKQGMCILDAPKAKGICGFPGQTNYELTGLTISTTNEYVVVNVVSMDDQPISDSEKILIQIGTVYQPTAWKETPVAFAPNDDVGNIQGFRIESLGRMPWKAAKTEVTIKLKGLGVKSAWQLDAAGYPSREINTVTSGGETVIELPEDAMYVILETITSTGVNKNEEIHPIRVYPNPSNGTFRLYLPAPYRDLGIGRIEVSGISGNHIGVFDYSPHTTSLELNAPPGAYLLKMYLRNEGMLTRRVVIE